MPAPNVTVKPAPMGTEEIICRVPQPQSMVVASSGQREQQMVSILMGGSPVERDRVKTLLLQDPELNQRVMMLWKQQAQQQPATQVIPADIAPHQPQPMAFNSARQSAASMMGVHTLQSGYSPSHPQPMRAMPAQHYSSISYRPSAYHQPMHPMMAAPHGTAQVYPQHPAHSSQLSRMLQRPSTQPAYQSPPTAYSQMPQTHPMGPPPQYPMRVPPQPQTAGYPHMLGHHSQPLPAHNTMTPQPVGLPMQQGPAPHQFSSAHHSPYSLNTNNNNSLSLSHLPPDEKLSRLSELL